jgi:hypothetical protein
MLQLSKTHETQFEFLSTPLHSMNFHLLHKKTRKQNIYIFIYLFIAWVQFTD